MNLYTIGYATKDIKDFVKILKLNNVNCIIDVRSSPFSKQFPEYNEYNLKKYLNENAILYLSFGKEFGARRDEKDAYKKVKMYDETIIDVVSFEKVYNLESFKAGYNRVITGLEKGYKIAFMCSEKYAHDCHRGIMVSEYFYRLGYNVKHLIDNDNIMDHECVESILKENFIKAKKKFERIHLSELNELKYASDLFGVNLVDEYITFWNDFFSEYSREKAFELRNYEIGYKKGNDEND